ncbi:hypothetical protein [Acinetobacter lanii]|uniref:hypothetical protein n=1 Tax=Acinetobacter lanii TaxID=2715163 RepID=UPI0018C8AF33|nr:hypothetical protein [Acinetobacter lanii]
MNYRSNPFNQIDYSKFSFKKSEILEMLKAVNSNFDFDEGNEAKHQIMSTQVNHDVLIPQNDYKFFLFKKPLLTFHEASCIMTGYDPQYVEQCRNDTNFKQNFSNYLGAKDYIDACCDAHMLCYNPMDNRIDAKDFKQFLANNDTFIAGFNDYLKSEFIDQNLDNQNSTIDQLKKENEILKAELAEKEQKIKELESLNCKKDTDLLSLIFDVTKKERFSPDLVLAIKLWEYVYIVNPKDDSHSNKADTWLRANTGYDVDKKAGSASKIREVTTPFINWSTHRDKSYTK